MDRVGKYQLVRKLATGGMAEVFLARAEGPGGFSKKLVVKRILPHFVSDPTFANMFLSEARLAAELNHPNVVQIFDFGQTDGQYYLAMEYIDGANLRVLNTAATEAGVRVPFVLAARLASHAAEGLHFAHELKSEDGKPIGLIHRDISPDNILVSRAGAVKVVDFGIAKASAQPSLTRSGVIKGKMAYMPPEQLGRKALDRRVDIFALGVVLHELVTGTWPFDASSEVSIIQAIMNEAPFTRVRERRADVPEALEAIIAKCLEKGRELRYSTCKELQADLEKFIASTGQQVFPADLSDLVNRLVPANPNADISQPINQGDLPQGRTLAPGEAPPADDGLGRTFPSQLSASQRGLTPVEEPKLKPSTLTASRSLLPMVAVGAAAGAVLVTGILFAMRDPLPLPLPPPPGLTVAAPDAGAEAEDAGAQLVVAPPAVFDAGLAPAPDAGPAEVAVVRPAGPKLVRVEFRIRPFAKVFLDGKELGETPFPAVAVPVGKHKIRLVNPQLKKNIEVEHTFRVGDTSFKYNLKE